MTEPAAWNEDEESLAAAYETWETEDLVRAVTADAPSYTPESLSLLQRELERRNVPPAEHQALLETAEAEKRSDHLVGVKGWLRFFVVILTLSSLVLVLATSSAWVWEPSFSLWTRFLLMSPVLLGLLGLVTSVLLVRRYRWAPRWAIAWLLLNIVLGIGSRFFLDGSTSLIPNFLVGLLWTRYFMVSKRVKATYGEAPALRDSDLSFPQGSDQINNPYAPPGSRRAD